MMTLNSLVYCEPNGNMTQPFIGRIEKVYERSVMVAIVGHHHCDRWKVIELTGRAIVALSKIRPAAMTTPQPCPIPALMPNINA